MQHAAAGQVTRAQASPAAGSPANPPRHALPSPGVPGPGSQPSPGSTTTHPCHGTPHGTPPAGVNAWGQRFAAGHEGFLPERAGGSEVRGLWAGAAEARHDCSAITLSAAGSSPRAKRFIPPQPLPAAAPERSLDGDHQERAWPRSLPSLRLFFFLLELQP